MRTTSSSRIRSRQRRIVALAAGPVLVAGMALAVSFTNSFADGTQVAGIRVNHADYVWPVKDNGAMPYLDTADVPRTLPAGSTLTATDDDAAASKITDWRYPSWTIEDPANGAGNATVDQEGDIALIDARGGNATGGESGIAFGTPRTSTTTVTTTPKDYVLNRDNLKAVKVNVFIENMNQMQETYDSYYLPIKVYKWTKAAATWTPVASPADVDQSGKYLHSLDGTMSFTFQACEGCFYGITIARGGNLHVANAPTSTPVMPKLYYTSSAVNYANN